MYVCIYFSADLQGFDCFEECHSHFQIVLPILVEDAFGGGLDFVIASKAGLFSFCRRCLRFIILSGRHGHHARHDHHDQHKHDEHHDHEDIIGLRS